MGPVVRSRGIQLKGWQRPTCQPRIRAGIRHILMLQLVCPGPAVRAKTLHDIIFYNCKGGMWNLKTGQILN